MVGPAIGGREGRTLGEESGRSGEGATRTHDDNKSNNNNNNSSINMERSDETRERP